MKRQWLWREAVTGNRCSTCLRKNYLSHLTKFDLWLFGLVFLSDAFTDSASPFIPQTEIPIRKTKQTVYFFCVVWCFYRRLNRVIAEVLLPYRWQCTFCFPLQTPPRPSWAPAADTRPTACLPMINGKLHFSGQEKESGSQRPAGSSGSQPRGHLYREAVISLGWRINTFTWDMRQCDNWLCCFLPASCWDTMHICNVHPKHREFSSGK